MELQSILTDIHALEQDLLLFERKYGVRSETFYAAYASGEEPEDDAWVLDFGEWASVYRTWNEFCSSESSCADPGNPNPNPQD